jgi:hypothetical protein
VRFRQPGEEPQQRLNWRRHIISQGSARLAFREISGPHGIVQRQAPQNASQWKLVAIEHDRGWRMMGDMGGPRQQRLAHHHPVSEPQMSQAARGEILPCHAPHPTISSLVA